MNHSDYNTIIAVEASATGGVAIRLDYAYAEVESWLDAPVTLAELPLSETSRPLIDWATQRVGTMVYVSYAEGVLSLSYESEEEVSAQVSVRFSTVPPTLGDMRSRAGRLYRDLMQQRSHEQTYQAAHSRIMTCLARIEDKAERYHAKAAFHASSGNPELSARERGKHDALIEASKSLRRAADIVSSDRADPTTRSDT